MRVLSFAVPRFGTRNVVLVWVTSSSPRVSAALERIAETPDSYPAWLGIRAVAPIIRRVVLQRFPYVIAFQKCWRYALVLAVAHTRRRPLYWLKRASA